MWPFNYPYTNFHELNLDWILSNIKQIESSVESIRKNLPKFANPPEWNSERTYASNEEVVYQGFIFIALRDVPQGVGLGDSNYWLPISENPTIFTTPQEYGAYGDNEHDDTEAIRAALASGKIVAFPKGTYKITGTIDMRSNSAFIGYHGAEIIQHKSGITSFTITEKQHVVINGVSFSNVEKKATLGSEDNCFVLTGAENITFERCKFHNFTSDVVTTYTGTDVNKNIRILNCENSKFDFAYLLAQFENVIISGNFSHDADRSALESGGTYKPPHTVYVTDRASLVQPRDLFIVNCEDKNNRFADSFKVRNCENVVISNIITSGCQRGIELASVKNAIVHDVIVSDMHTALEGDSVPTVLHIYDVENVYIDNVNGNCENSKYFARIHTDKSSENKNIVIKNCSFIEVNENGNYKNPFDIEDSKGVEIENFHLTNNGSEYRRMYNFTNSSARISGTKLTMPLFSSYRLNLANFAGNCVIRAFENMMNLPEVNTETQLENRYYFSQESSATVEKKACIFLYPYANNTEYKYSEISFQ